MGKNDENISLYILSPNGKICYRAVDIESKQNRVTHKEVDATRIPSGFYQVFIKSKNKLYRSKFLKMSK